jgi:hypothetical protein
MVDAHCLRQHLQSLYKDKRIFPSIHLSEDCFHQRVLKEIEGCGRHYRQVTGCIVARLTIASSGTQLYKRQKNQKKREKEIVVKH